MESLNLKQTQNTEEIPESNYNKDIILLSNYIKELISRTETQINFSYEDGINLLYESRAFMKHINNFFHNLNENGVKKLNNDSANKIGFELLNLLEIKDNKINIYLLDIIKTIIVKECELHGINTELVN